jgi:hypothetical protein
MMLLKMYNQVLVNECHIEQLKRSDVNINDNK